jgi:hypothetical protein
MVTPNASRPDEDEQTGVGLRQLLRRFNAATTREELSGIAAEAERRDAWPRLEPSLETAYGVLASLARKRMAALISGECSDAAGGAGTDRHGPDA